MDGKDDQQARCVGCRVPIQNIAAIVICVSPLLFKEDKTFLSAIPQQSHLNTPLRVESGKF
jgi:hypothetical protein